jgi:hypothetical protein
MPFPRGFVMRVAAADRDRTGEHVTIVDVPAFLTGIGRSAAGEFGHSSSNCGIEGVGKPSYSLSLKIRAEWYAGTVHGLSNSRNKAGASAGHCNARRLGQIAMRNTEVGEIDRHCGDKNVPALPVTFNDFHTEQAIAACDGDLRATVQALIVANGLLEAELTDVYAAASRGYARGGAKRKQREGCQHGERDLLRCLTLRVEWQRAVDR